jgi:hypothetical protein
VFERLDRSYLPCNEPNPPHELVGAKVVGPKIYRDVFASLEGDLPPAVLESRLTRHPRALRFGRFAAVLANLFDRIPFGDQPAAASDRIGECPTHKQQARENPDNSNRDFQLIPEASFALCTAGTQHRSAPYPPAWRAATIRAEYSILGTQGSHSPTDAASSVRILLTYRLQSTRCGAVQCDCRAFAPGLS